MNHPPKINLGAIISAVQICKMRAPQINLVRKRPDDFRSLFYAQEYLHHAADRISQNRQGYINEYSAYQTTDTVKILKQACNQIIFAGDFSNIQN